MLQGRRPRALDCATPVPPSYSLAHLPARSVLHPYGLGPCTDDLAVAAICSEGSVVGIACMRGGVDKLEETGRFGRTSGIRTMQRPTPSELALTFKDCDIVHGRVDLAAKSFTPHPTES